MTSVHVSTANAWSRLARVADLEGAGPFAVSANGIDLVLVRSASGWRVYEGHCPHQGALLGEGELEGGTLVCRNHRWRFAADTGQRRGGPQCLASCPVEERDGELWVDPSALAYARTAVPPAPARRVSDLPHYRGLPLLGNIHQLELGSLHLILERWAAELGPAFRYRMGPHQVMAIADPALNEQVLRARPDTFRRASTLEPIFEEMGLAGVFSAEGPTWRAQRRLAMQALSHRHLRGFYPTLARIMERLHTRWNAKALAGEVLDIADELKRFTVDITTLLVFGHDVDTIGQGDDVIQRKLELVFPVLNRRLFAVMPTWRWLRMPSDRRLDRAVSELWSWIRQLIAAARARLASEPARAEQPANFLESMIAARDADGMPFTDDVICGNAMTMLLAGEDTTAYTLAWAVHHLCEQPEVVGVVRREALSALGAAAAPPDIDAANALTFAGAVANETMRLRPVAPLMLFEANHDTTIGDVAVPKGTWVTTLTRPPVMEERRFADAAKFRPGRWMADQMTNGAHDASSHMPFGSGPRICPGRTLALLEMKMLLAMLYGRFDVERVGDAGAVREKFSFTMSPVGLRVRLRSRSASDEDRSHSDDRAIRV